MAFPELGRLKPGSLGFLLAPLVAVLVGVQAGTSDRRVERPVESSWSPGVPVSIPVRNGRATFRVPSGGPGSECAVIVSALSRAPGPFAIRLEAQQRRVRDDSGTGCRGPRSAPGDPAVPAGTPGRGLAPPAPAEP